MAGNKLGILSNARTADVILDPFPHLVIRDALDPDVFASLESQFPADDVVVNRRPVNDTWYDYTACNVVRDDRVSPLWREFFAYHVSAVFFRDLVGLLGDQIMRTYPQLEAQLGRPLAELKVGMSPGGKGDPSRPAPTFRRNADDGSL